ncbi:hypothetical protein EDC01DRAFT_7475 [Geopyxis carbonaria]|nr:hypothetical protein EDC01DRAFT_7475 [Geopyxis carbonaria]
MIADATPAAEDDDEEKICARPSRSMEVLASLQPSRGGVTGRTPVAPRPVPACDTAAWCGSAEDAVEPRRCRSAHGRSLSHAVAVARGWSGAARARAHAGAGAGAGREGQVHATATAMAALVREVEVLDKRQGSDGVWFVPCLRRPALVSLYKGEGASERWRSALEIGLLWTLLGAIYITCLLLKRRKKDPRGPCRTYSPRGASILQRKWEKVQDDDDDGDDGGYMQTLHGQKLQYRAARADVSM